MTLALGSILIYPVGMTVACTIDKMSHFLGMPLAISTKRASPHGIALAPPANTMPGFTPSKTRARAAMGATTDGGHF
jgi:hypothetical protein